MSDEQRCTHAGVMGWEDCLHCNPVALEARLPAAEKRERDLAGRLEKLSLDVALSAPTGEIDRLRTERDGWKKMVLSIFPNAQLGDW